MKDYYKILEVSPNATQDEIKKAYRRLAFKYHPDKNNSPMAQALIQEINVAYDVIGDVKKRETYNFRYNSRNTSYPPVNKTSNKKRTTPYTPPRATYKKKVQRFDFPGWAEKGRYVSAFILFYCVLIGIDYYISSEYKNTVVEKMEIFAHRTRRSTSHFTFHIQSTKVNFEVSSEAVNFGEGDTINVDISPLFGFIKSIERIKNREVYALDHIISFYSPIIFMIFLLAGTSLAAILIKAPETSFNFSTSNLILFLIVMAIKWLI
jgi:curved DNA-binding protein CbpA